jgi:AcrR family transcriptional regulator
MPEPETQGAPIRRPRRRRSDGERSRTAILHEATRLATVEGLAGLSIGRLADVVGMSKSGLFAHFGSKEDRQLATIDTAAVVFDAEVTGPARAAPTAYLRLRALLDGYLRHVTGDAFPGGCFFASVLSEVDMQPGPVRDRMVAFMGDWLVLVEATIREAQEQGDIRPEEDPGQLTFELEALLFLANAVYILDHLPISVERARTAIDRRLAVAREGIA